jgi:UPF0271 protein
LRTAVDLNADLGEGDGTSRLAEDTKLLSLVSSANIACGYHAGDAISIRETIRVALDTGVVIGAHPSYDDRAGFGRRDLEVPAEKLRTDIVKQIETLAEACATGGGNLRYVKPHGALYNRAARDPAVAQIIADSIRSVDSALVLLGLAGNAMLDAGRDAGLTVVAEAFADRGYRDDATLVPRSDPGALLDDPVAIAARAVRLVKEEKLLSRDGRELAISADSLCTHGDGPNALSILRSLRAGLEQAGITIAPFAH